MAVIIPAILNDGQIVTVSIQDGAVSNDKLENSEVIINNQNLELGGTLTLTTDDVGEGTLNLYYTDGRFDTRLSTKTTSDITEGTNLYFTDTRATDAVEANGSLSLGNIVYNQNGVFPDRWELKSVGKIEIVDNNTAGAFTWLNSGDIYLGHTGGIQINSTDIQTWGSTTTIDINSNTNIKDNLIGVHDWGGFGLDANGGEFKSESGSNRWASLALKEWDKSNQHFGIFYPNVTGFIAEGTETSPQPISNGDIMLILNGFGQWGTGTTDIHHACEIKFRANENFSSTNRGSAITFDLTPTGTTGREQCLYWDASSTENKLTFDGGGNFTRTRISSNSTDGLVFGSDTTFFNVANFDDIIRLRPTDEGNLPASPLVGSIAFLRDDATPTTQNKPIYYDGTVWRYFSNDAAI